MPTPISVIHAALLHNGKVLFIADAYSPNTLIWDPEDPVEATAFTLLSGAMTGLGTNRLACCGHSFLQDGKLLAVGGDAPTRATAFKFNPTTNMWESAGTMSAARWYPTCVTLGDDSGRVLVVGGSTSNGGPTVPSMEIYRESSNDFTRVWGPAGVGDTSADRSFPKLYPGLHLTPNGEIFHTRVGDRTGTPDRSANFTFTALDRGQWTEVTTAATDLDRDQGMSVLLLKQTPTDPDRVLVVGGGSSSPSSIAVVDIPGFVRLDVAYGELPGWARAETSQRRGSARRLGLHLRRAATQRHATQRGRVDVVSPTGRTRPGHALHDGHSPIRKTASFDIAVAPECQSHGIGW